jgi:phosphate:Na+ symporter
MAYLELTEPNLVLKKEIEHLEHVTDNIQKEVTLFLTTVLQMAVTPEQAARAYSWIRTADEVESVGDYCLSLVNYHARLLERGEAFSHEAQKDFRSLLEETRSLFEAVVQRIAREGTRVESSDLMARGESLRSHADAIRDGHLERVESGRCDALAGLTFSDMIVALRRIKNHSINMVDARNSSWETRAESLRVLDRVRRKSVEPPAHA